MHVYKNYDDEPSNQQDMFVQHHSGIEIVDRFQTTPDHIHNDGIYGKLLEFTQEHFFDLTIPEPFLLDAVKYIFKRPDQEKGRLRNWAETILETVFDQLQESNLSRIIIIR